MLTPSRILKVEKFNQQYGDNNGACFGTADASRLRSSASGYGRRLKSTNKTMTVKTGIDKQGNLRINIGGLENQLNYGSSPIPLRKGAIPANIEFGQDLKKYLSGVHQRKASYVIGAIANARTGLIARIEKTESLECVAKLPHVGEAMLRYVRDCVAKEYSVDIDLLEDKKALKAARHQ